MSDDDDSRERWALRVLSGADRGLGASILRGGLRLVEPFYAAAMQARNDAYDVGLLESHRLPRPTISVGNVTTGGTGKTPVVRWLAEQLSARGFRPAVLMRGYRAKQTGGSDEQQMLEKYLGGRASVVANPDRVAGAAEAIQQSPPPDVFVLDDGFQHRRVRRDFDLLLVNAADPFGFGHVLPRGLLREPVGGMNRADAILVTHDDPANPLALPRLDARIPIFRSSHAHASLRRAGLPDLPIERLRAEKFFAFSGIANPASLREQLARHGETFLGFRAFPDHHAYTEADLAALRDQAAAAGATMLITTEKDWVKVRRLLSALSGLPIVRIELRLQFAPGDEQRLLERVLARVAKLTATETSSAPRTAPTTAPTVRSLTTAATPLETAASAPGETKAAEI